MPDYYLHIGTPKTGSTALQIFLESNPIALGKYGALYPSRTLRGHGHHDIAFHIAGGYPAWASPAACSLKETAQAFRDEVQAQKEGLHQKIIFSSENFYLLCDPQAVAEFLYTAGIPAKDLTIVVYIRRQDEIQVSWYNQRIKAQGFSGSLSESIAEYSSQWHYEQQLDRWEKAFPDAKLIVRPYQRADIPDLDIRKDFLRIIQAEEAEFSFAAEDTNSSLNIDLLEFQKEINKLYIDNRTKRKFHKALIALSKTPSSQEFFSTKALLNTKQKKSLLSRYREGNRLVAIKYLGRNDLFDESMEIGKPSSVKPGLTVEKMFRIMAWLLLSDERKA